MIDFLLFLLYKLIKFFILLLPKNITKYMLDILVKLVLFIDKKHIKIAKINLDLVFQDTKSTEEKEQIIKQSYQNLLYNIYEFIQNQTLTLQDLEQKLTIHNEQYILDALKNKRKIILITAHYGNWEYGSTFIPLKYAPTTVVGRPLNNKFLNKELKQTRTKNNNELLSKNQASKGLIKAIKNGKILGLVIDQNNPKGIEVEFLNQKIKMIDSSSRLALKFDAIILPVFFRPIEFGKYIVDFIEPLDPRKFQNQENSIYNLTQSQATIISDYIIKYPSYHLWQHRIFKEFQKDIYK